MRVDQFLLFLQKPGFGFCCGGMDENFCSDPLLFAGKGASYAPSELTCFLLLQGVAFHRKRW